MVEYVCGCCDYKMELSETVCKNCEQQNCSCYQDIGNDKWPILEDRHDGFLYTLEGEVHSRK